MHGVVQAVFVKMLVVVDFDRRGELFVAQEPQITSLEQAHHAARQLKAVQLGHVVERRKRAPPADQLGDLAVAFVEIRAFLGRIKALKAKIARGRRWRQGLVEHKRRFDVGKGFFDLGPFVAKADAVHDQVIDAAWRRPKGQATHRLAFKLKIALIPEEDLKHAVAQLHPEHMLQALSIDDPFSREDQAHRLKTGVLTLGLEEAQPVLGGHQLGPHQTVQQALRLWATFGFDAHDRAV